MCSFDMGTATLQQFFGFRPVFLTFLHGDGVLEIFHISPSYAKNSFSKYLPVPAAGTGLYGLELFPHLDKAHNRYN